MTVDDLIKNFGNGLGNLVPEVESLGIPWRRPQAYDEWDSIATATFNSLVVTPLRWTLPEPEQDAFQLPAYDLLLESYAGFSLIEVNPEQTTGPIRAFHALGTTHAPFDTVEWRLLSAAGQPISPTFETSLITEVRLTLRHTAPNGSIHHIQEVDVPASRSSLSSLKELKLDSWLIKLIHIQTQAVLEPRLQIILSWDILTQFGVALWEQDHPGLILKRGDGRAFDWFARHPLVEAVWKSVLKQRTGQEQLQPSAQPGARRMRAEELSRDSYFDALRSIRNNITHSPKAPSTDVDILNIRFASIQIQSLVEKLAEAAGIDLKG